MLTAVYHRRSIETRDPWAEYLYSGPLCCAKHPGRGPSDPGPLENKSAPRVRVRPRSAINRAQRRELRPHLKRSPIHALHHRQRPPPDSSPASEDIAYVAQAHLLAQIAADLVIRRIERGDTADPLSVSLVGMRRLIKAFANGVAIHLLCGNVPHS